MDLLRLIAKQGSRLGAVTGQRMLRSMGRDSFILSQDVTARLIAEGVVRVELWRHRYRVVEVLKGKHAGARTKEYEGPDLCPKRIIDVTEENGGQTLKKQR